MSVLRRMYQIWKDQMYIIRVILLYFSGKKIVLYTKKHPIYTACFEENPPEGYVFYCPIPTLFNNWVIARASIFHVDANMPVTFSDKPVVIECEAIPPAKYFNEKQVKHVLVQSQYAGRLNPEIPVLYPAVPVSSRDRSSLRSSVTLLAVGHGGMIKGYDVVSELYKKLKEKHDVKLIIAGSFGHNFQFYPEITPESYHNAEFEKISLEFKQDPNVTFKSFSRKELYDKVYPEADIYIHLCRMETFGFSVLEAMSFGLPVVSCHFKAIPEMVEHGRNGFLVQSLQFDKGLGDYKVNINSDEWKSLCFQEAYEYIVKLIVQPELRKKMGEESIQVVKERFDVEHKKKVLYELYKGLL